VSILHQYEQFRRVEGQRLWPHYPTKAHLAPRRLQLEFQGHLVKISLKGGVPRPLPAKRGTITGFSHASRLRLMEKFNRFHRPAHTTFVSLTYPAEFPSPEAAKDNLRAFLERLRRMPECAKSSGIWRIELQKRGAPHFHILFFDLPYIRKKKIQEMWGDIIGAEQPFTRIEAVRTWHGIMSYCSKYIAKAEEELPAGNDGFIYLSYLHGLGRIWGVFQRANLPFAPLKMIQFPFIIKIFSDFRHLATMHYPALLEREAPGFQIWVKNADEWLSLWYDCANLPF
jgi:hypothetical protein